MGNKTFYSIFHCSFSSSSWACSRLPGRLLLWQFGLSLSLEVREVVLRINTEQGVSSGLHSLARRKWYEVEKNRSECEVMTQWSDERVAHSGELSVPSPIIIMKQLKCFHNLTFRCCCLGCFFLSDLLLHRWSSPHSKACQSGWCVHFPKECGRFQLLMVSRSISSPG